MAIEINPEDVISRLKSLEGCEYQKDLEPILNINRGGLSAYVKRGTLPYKEIILYCLDRNIEINYVLGKKIVTED